jgi:diguanylate cyclase (GGDEF)-like protein
MSIFSILAHALVLSAVVGLVVSLALVRRLISQLPTGSMRSRWHLLSLLVMAFIASYLSYTIATWQAHHNWHDLIVPAVFFFGACFVWLTAGLALRTTEDLRQLVKLEHENITDPLLGIYNRRYLNRKLEEETSRALRYKMPLSLLMVDVDHFKNINDTHGHQIGDQALIHLSRLLMDSVRNLDVVARYGGEEVLIIVPDTPPQTATELARRLNQYVAGQPLTVTDTNGIKQEIRMTVSIGVASLNYQSDNMQKLLERADAALYQAKQNGRNQVVVSEANFGE